MVLVRRFVKCVQKDVYKRQVIDCPYEVDDFYGEISHFVNLLENGKQSSPIMPIQSSLETARLLDRIKDAMTPNPIEI